MKTRTDIQKKLSLLSLARNAERGLQPQRNTFENRIGDQIGDSAVLTCLALWFSLQNAVLLTFFAPAQNSLADGSKTPKQKFVKIFHVDHDQPYQPSKPAHNLIYHEAIPDKGIYLVFSQNFYFVIQPI